MECPICMASFPPAEITAHVNACLEGSDSGGSTTTSPTPKPEILPTPTAPGLSAPSAGDDPWWDTNTAGDAGLRLPPPLQPSHDDPLHAGSAPMDVSAPSAQGGGEKNGGRHDGDDGEGEGGHGSGGGDVMMNGNEQPLLPEVTMDDAEDDLARMQKEALRYWEERRRQEEEDRRLARMLEQQAEEEKNAAAKTEPVSKPPVPTPTTGPATGPQKAVPDELLTQLELLRKIEEEERKREEEDRRLAEELWRKEEEEERERKKKREWEETLTLVRTQAKAESDEELAKALREREELLRQLERLKAEADATKFVPDAVDPHVSVTLEGVEYPERWVPQKAEFQTFDVKKGTEEWNDIANHFINTLGGMGATITRIERNQNKSLWTFYYLRRQQVALKNRKDPNEKYLFHGSRANAYDTILKEGFDHRVANMGGAIGAGVYFATHASTSTGYVTGGHTKKMLYCRVTLGSVGRGKSGIRRPPEKNGGGLHDSVGQVHGGNGMYVVFDNHQAFPEYTIHYT